MNLLLYEEFYIRTHLPHSALRQKMQHITDTSFHLFTPLSYKKTYFGQVTSDGFRIHQGTERWSPFSLPVVAGYFMEAKNGEIIIKMRLSPHWTLLIGLLFSFVLYFMLYGIAFGLIITIFSNLIRGNDAVILFGVSLISLVLSFISMRWTMWQPYQRQVRFEKQYFLELTEAYEVIDMA